MPQKNTLNRLRKIIAAIADGRSDARTAATEALALLDGLLARAGRGEADVGYVVEDTVNGPALTERRRGGRAYPFRCPQPVYDAMVKVMVESERAMPLDELAGAVSTMLGDQPPDYQVRVPLRLWMQVDPPLVNRNRARYRPSDSGKFSAQAKALWSSLQAG